MKVGNAEVFVISAGYYMADGGGTFGLVPRSVWERYRQPDDRNRVAQSLNCMLVKSAGKTILVDTGYGDKLPAKQQEIFGYYPQEGLVANLRAVGVRPEDVDIVINSHLHGDHAGGNTRYEGNKIVPTFPNATYWIQRADWEAATHPNERTRATYLAENFRPLFEGGLVKLIEGPTVVTDEVETIMAPGHGAGHQLVLVSSQGQSAIFLADLAQVSVQMERLAWVAGYDIEPMVSIETKRQIMRQLAEKHTLLIFSHDALTPTGYLYCDGEKYRFEPFDIGQARD